MKKALTTLVIMAALVAGSVSFAGTGSGNGGYRYSSDTSPLDCKIATVSTLECQDFSAPR